MGVAKAAVVRRGKVWQVQVRVGKDPATGKWVRKSVTCDTKAEAERAERLLLAEAEAQRQRFVEPTRQTLGQYLPQWVERKRTELKPKTLHDYERVVRTIIVPALGAKPLQDLSPAMIQAWQDTLAPTPDTPGAAQAALAFRCLRSALSDAERLGLITENPAKRARPALRASRKREGFTLGEARAILAASESEGLAPLFEFVLYTGLRLGEALGLRWSDVDWEAGRIAVRHNRVPVGGHMIEGSPKVEKSVRTMALLAAAMDVLRRQRALQDGARIAAAKDWRDDGWVFTTRTGGGLDASNAERAFRRIRKRAGVRELPPHSLRHATASILLGAGVPVAVAAKMMGHSVAVFCEVYADLLVEATHDAARQADQWLAQQAPLRDMGGVGASVKDGGRRATSRPPVAPRGKSEKGQARL